MVSPGTAAQPFAPVDLSIGSVCTGIGGLDLGLEWAGLGPVRWQVEPDPYCRRVLARHWPHVGRLSHVQAVPRAARLADLPRVGVFVGGFPCQDVSQANPGGLGLDGERSGLFWWVLDCIDELQPGVVVLENVGRLVGRGLDVVGRELTDRGFAVEVTRLRAEDVGAPQRRERVFILAYALRRQPERRGGPGELAREESAAPGQGVQRERDGDASRDRRATLAHPDRGRCEEFGLAEPSGVGSARGDELVRRDGEGEADGGSSQSGLGGGPHGLSARLDDQRWPAPRGVDQHEWEPPRVRPREPGDRARLRALGNAVVPQCGYVVGLRVRQMLGLGPPSSTRASDGG